MQREYFSVKAICFKCCLLRVRLDLFMAQLKANLCKLLQFDVFGKSQKLLANDCLIPHSVRRVAVRFP